MAADSFGWAAGDGTILVQPHMEYLRKNRWILEFAALPAGIKINEAGASLRLNCSKAARPKISFEETEVKRLNGSIFLAGKPKFETMTVSFYDSAPMRSASGATSTGSDAFGAKLAESVPSASMVMEAWRETMYQPNSGDAFGSAANYKGLAYLHMLEPQPLESFNENADNMSYDSFDVGNSIAQTWIYQGLFPLSIDYGELDYASNEVQEISVIFRYDRAYRVKPSTATVK